MQVEPVFSRDQAQRLVQILTKLIQGYRDMGFYVIKHTDGNIMPILDQLAQANPHALHSIDPQAGVDIAEVKRRVGSQVALIGNVNCALMDTGTDDEVAASVRESKPVTLSSDGAEWTLAPEEILVETTEAANLAVAEDKGLTIALNTTLTPELECEGFSRDIVRHIQQMRKEADLALLDERLLDGLQAGSFTFILRSLGIDRGDVVDWA